MPRAPHGYAEYVAEQQSEESCHHGYCTEVRTLGTNELVGHLCLMCDQLWEACEA